ncbi:LacI family DNA-binding transcriptional regulator [Terriglobus albidus]|uniref:LacI family DNA-binding transcriptional regulator n=1 Tax=Terriglobus albidus TaxID=1592106 RepID=UPI0021E0B5DE|nr:LacI family DNA-binding transcriptional regulator [Terriglobus albidus]
MVQKKGIGKSQRQTPTIREVARVAGVGVMTVSRVINDHPAVKPKTKKKVLTAIQQLGYERNEAAGLLKGQRAMMIGLIVPDLSDIFFAHCANTIEKLARESGYLTLIVSSGHDVELETQQAELMARRKLSGLLLVTSGTLDVNRIQRVIEGGLPIVAFDRPLEGLGTDAVLIENRAGAEEAVEHLISHGHKRIACVGFDSEAYPVAERVKGYRSAMSAHGLRPYLSMKVDCLEAAMNWVDSARLKQDAPTAVFSTNYRTTVHLLRAFSERKVKIPSEVAIIGFDDFELAPVIAPPVTTVGQSAVDLARRAFRLLLDRIEITGSDVGRSPEKILLPATLIVRESCGAHPRSKKTAEPV